MKTWHAIYAILKTPLEVLSLSLLLAGLSNVLINPYYGLNILVQNNYLFALGTLLMQVARFVIINFPFMVLLSFAFEKRMGVSAVVSYVGYIVGTLIAPTVELPTFAYAKIFDIHRSLLSSSTLRYPLQTGLVGVLLVTAICGFVQKRNREKKEAMIGLETKLLLKTGFLCTLIGIGMGFAWPFFIKGIEYINAYITMDTNDSFRIGLFGLMDKLLQTFHLGAFVRQPFWYGLNGGTWVNLAGGIIKGDAYIWTAQMSANQTTALAGHLFTPFYAMNLVIVPGLIWTFFFLETNRAKRKKKMGRYLLLTVTSWLAGVSLPIQLALLFLSPLLFIFYAGINGLLYAFLQITQIRLGYLTSESHTFMAMPGTLTEYLHYLNETFLHQNLMWIVVIGIVFLILSIVMTRFYFKYLALDIFHSGKRNKMVQKVLVALGDVSNIQQIDSSMDRLTVRLYDSSLLDESLLKEAGCSQVDHSCDGEELLFGACSTMLRMDILKEIREKPNQ